MKGEGRLINKWWDQNCTSPLMQAPASFSRAWSGIVAHTTFAHYPKNVIPVESFCNAIK